jgi:hypothetical protein
MTEIEVQNKINFRNIIIFFLIGIGGIINGIRDFDIYQIDIAKILFPDPTVYHNVVVLNNSMMSILSVQNSVSFGGLSVLIIVMIVVVMVIGSTCGMMGAMGD